MVRLSTKLQRFFKEHKSPEVDLTDILKLVEERVFGVLFVILSLPSALPIPAPGYSTPFGLLMLLLALQLMIGAKIPWLPECIAKYPVKLETAQVFLKIGLPWLYRIEAITRQRLSFICTTLPGRIIIGIAITLVSILMIIPIPGTNTLPAISIFVTGFGLQEHDGAISLAGLTLCILGIMLSASIIIATAWGSSSLLDLIRIWLRSL